MKHRKPNRLQNYDYSQNGLYFITICTQNKKCYFGEIIDDKMILNIAGDIAQKYWKELEKQFNIKLHEYVIMPNHMHGIIEINQTNNTVGTGLVPVLDNCNTKTPTRGVPTISNIIGAYKSYTTTAYIKEIKKENLPPFQKHLWQRSFYDHIIRKDESLNKIKEYIMINPRQWYKDKFNLENYNM